MSPCSYTYACNRTVFACALVSWCALIESLVYLVPLQTRGFPQSLGSSFSKYPSNKQPTSLCCTLPHAPLISNYLVCLIREHTEAKKELERDNFYNKVSTGKADFDVPPIPGDTLLLPNAEEAACAGNYRSRTRIYLHTVCLSNA